MEEIGKQQFYIMYLNVYLVAYLWVFLKKKTDKEPNEIIVNLWFQRFINTESLFSYK